MTPPPRPPLTSASTTAFPPRLPPRHVLLHCSASSPTPSSTTASPSRCRRADPQRDLHQLGRLVRNLYSSLAHILSLLISKIQSMLFSSANFVGPACSMRVSASAASLPRDMQVQPRPLSSSASQS